MLKFWWCRPDSSRSNHEKTLAAEERAIEALAWITEDLIKPFRSWKNEKQNAQEWMDRSRLFENEKKTDAKPIKALIRPNRPLIVRHAETHTSGRYIYVKARSFRCWIRSLVQILSLLFEDTYWVCRWHQFIEPEGMENVKCMLGLFFITSRHSIWKYKKLPEPQMRKFLSCHAPSWLPASENTPLWNQRKVTGFAGQINVIDGHTWRSWLPKHRWLAASI
jgi:hypothetical protein